MKPFPTSKLAILTLVSLGAVAVPCTAEANPGITGYSGKPYNGSSQTCATSCHGGGAAKPSLTIQAPSALKAGEKGNVSITVSGSNTRTSFNAALSDGVTATAGQNTSIPFPDQTPGEVAAVAPPPGGSSATYTFSFVAPNKNGPITLWVAGMAASGSGSGGDGVTTETRNITISGATGGGGGQTDGGTGGGSSTSDGGTGSTGGGSTNDGNDGDGDGDDGDDGTPSGSSGGRRSVSSASTGGCAAANAGPDLAGLAVAAVGLAMIARGRRSRR